MCCPFANWRAVSPATPLGLPLVHVGQVLGVEEIAGRTAVPELLKGWAPSLKL